MTSWTWLVQLTPTHQSHTPTLRYSKPFLNPEILHHFIDPQNKVPFGFGLDILCVDWRFYFVQKKTTSQCTSYKAD
ncbi:hypothetical protein Pelo_2342 [Pelomyxa schiedti]|nr:hypothetical protein Pelo_2342 [Pelomyxa schiedti]